MINDESESTARKDDLALLIRRLVQSLKKRDPENALAANAIEYLRRHGLQGNPLRASTLGLPSMEGCNCQPGRCMAPVIMGRQQPCLDPGKRDG